MFACLVAITPPYVTWVVYIHTYLTILSLCLAGIKAIFTITNLITFARSIR